MESGHWQSSYWRRIEDYFNYTLLNWDIVKFEDELDYNYVCWTRDDMKNKPNKITQIWSFEMSIQFADDALLLVTVLVYDCVHVLNINLSQYLNPLHQFDRFVLIEYFLSKTSIVATMFAMRLHFTYLVGNLLLDLWLSTLCLCQWITLIKTALL